MSTEPRSASEEDCGIAPEIRPSTGYFASYLWNTLAKVGDFGLAYLFSVLLARMLEPVAYGTYASILSICTLVFVVTSIGIDNTLHKFIGEASASEKGLHGVPSLVGWLFLVRIVLTAAAVGIVFLLRGWIAARFDNQVMISLISVATLYMVGQSLVSFTANVLVGFLRTGTVAALTLVFRSANLVIAYGLLRSGAGIAEIMLLLGVMSGALFLAYLWKVFPLFIGTRGQTVLSPVFAFALTAWALAAVNFGLGKQSDVILLNAIRHDQTEIALYDVAFSLTQTAAMVLTIGLSGISLTLFSRRHRGRPEAMGTLWQSLIVVVSSAVIPLIVFLVAHADACVAAIYGHRYSDAGFLLRCYAIPMAVGWLVGGGASSTALHAINRIRMVLWIRVGTGLVNVLVNVLLIRAYGPVGALLGTGFCGATAVVIEAGVVRHALGSAIPTRHLPGILLGVTLAILPSVILRPGGVVALVWHGVAYVAIYLAVLRLVKPFPDLDEGFLGALPAPLARGLVDLRRRRGEI